MYVNGIGGFILVLIIGILTIGVPLILLLIALSAIKGLEVFARMARWLTFIVGGSMVALFIFYLLSPFL